ncbi:MAG: class I SAM-dependent methyltransferase [Sandaracinaceae bacterium]|nr:class I SAM-dependent methyltransferase [Sandaracinaceae bacterium]
MARRTHAGGAKKRPTLYAAFAPKTERMVLALRHHRHGRYEDACALYREEVAAAKDNVDAWMNLGTACVSLGLAQEARRSFAAATHVAEANARAARDVGIGLIAIGYLSEARTELERALALDANANGVRLVLARLCLDMGERLTAQEHAREAVRRAPDNASGHLELHRTLFDDTDIDASLPSVRRAVELDPSSSLARTHLAFALGRGRNPQECERVLNDAPQVIPPDAADAIRYALSANVRAFASKRETLLFGLGALAERGLAIELGVRHGISTRVLAARLPVLHGFDSFEGLPETWVTRRPGAFSTSGELPDLPPNVELHVGLFSESLPRFLATHAGPVRFLHVDSDLYSSARTALEHLAPRIGSGCVIIFDEYLGHTNWREHEWKAFHEACIAYQWRYEYLGISLLTGQAVVRIL